MIIVENLSKIHQGEDMEKTYFYRLIKDKFNLNYGDELIEVQSYGIEIERQDKVEGNIVNIERDYIENISPQRHKVHSLLKLLHENTVSPIHLIDIAGDYVDEYINDFDNVLKEIATN